MSSCKLCAPDNLRPPILSWEPHFWSSYVTISLDNCMVSHSEILCVLWKMLYLSNNNKKYELDFSIRSGLHCYLELYIINCGSRLLPYSEFSSTLSFLHAGVCLFVFRSVCSFMCMCRCVYYMEYSLGVFLQAVRSGFMI